MSVRLEPSWLQRLAPEFEQPYMRELKQFLQEEKAAGKTVFPPSTQIFHALDLCPFDRVKVVIIGQDPYHGPGQAHGLCFSVPDGVGLPPSLQNIIQEIRTDVGQCRLVSGDLSNWARQGVLLLNATLTVRAHSPGSHQGKGWELFTDAVVDALDAGKKDLVFMLWGRYAQEKAARLDPQKHLLLKAAHPSPFSAYKGFFGCSHFSKSNTWLEQRGLQPIDW